MRTDMQTRGGWGWIVVIIFLACAAARPAFADDPPRLADAVFPADFFPILPWGPLRGWQEPFVERKAALESIAECGFTMAGFVQPRDLPLCEKLGLAAIVAPPAMNREYVKAWRTLTDEQIEQRVRLMIEQAGNSKAVAGYYLIDEPGAPLFPSLGKAVAAVRKYAPGKLAYINLFPGYATIGAPDTSQLGTASFTEYLERYVAEVKPQFISYDNYMVQYSDDMRDPGKAASYYRDLLEVRRVAFKHGLPFWNIVSSNQIRPVTPPPSPANLLFQAYTTLAAGGRGVSWYTYYGGNPGKRGYAYAPIDQHEGQTATWGYLRMVNQQLRLIGPIMNRLQSTGVYFSAPAPVEGLPLLPGKILKEVDARASRRAKVAERLPVMVGEFTGPGGEEYVMVVNLSLEKSANLVLHTHKPVRQKTLISPQDGHADEISDETGLWLTAGQGALIQLK
jgi:hypothetical protein